MYAFCGSILGCFIGMWGCSYAFHWKPIPDAMAAWWSFPWAFTCVSIVPLMIAALHLLGDRIDRVTKRTGAKP